MNTRGWSFSVSTPWALRKVFLPLLWFPAVWKLHHCSDSARWRGLPKPILTTVRANNFPVLIKPEILGHNKVLHNLQKSVGGARSRVRGSTKPCSHVNPFSLLSSPLHLQPDAAEEPWLRFGFVGSVPEAFRAGRHAPLGPTTLRCASSVDCCSSTPSGVKELCHLEQSHGAATKINSTLRISCKNPTPYGVCLLAMVSQLANPS